jgi:protoporphyrinogen oxidase
MDWMTRWGGKEVTRVIWEPILRGKFFNYFDKIAMSYVWSRVHVRVNSKDKGDVTEKLGYFEGGFKIFADALIERAKALGVIFVLNTKPTAILRNPGRVMVVSGDKSDSFDACLATTPSHVFKHLISNNPGVPDKYLQKLMSVEYIGAVLMVFSTNKKYTDYYWHNVNDPDHPFLVLLSLSALVGSEQLGGRNVYYIGSYVPHDHEYFEMSDEAIKELWIEGTKKIFPDFDEATITGCEIFKFKNAQHIVDPGYEQKIVPYESPLKGVYLANFSQIFPEDRGTNFAVAEGTKVAHLIDGDLQQT